MTASFLHAITTSLTTNVSISNNSNSSSNNNNNNSVTQHEASTSDLTANERLVMSIQLATLSIFGTLGNGLVLYVYTVKRDKPAWAIFILSLAWCDFFTCLVVMPFTLVAELLDYRLVYDVVCKVYYFFITCNVPLSTFIMTAIAVDRYFSICHPFLHLMTPHRARITILCLCIFTSFFGTLTACMYGVYHLEIVTLAPVCPTGMDPGFANTTANNSGKDNNQRLRGQAAIGLHDSIDNATDKPDSVVTLSDIGSVSNSFGYGVDGYDSIFDSSHENISSGNNNSNNNNNTNNGTNGQQGTSPPNPVCTPVTEERQVYNECGFCRKNTILLSPIFAARYKKIYFSFYLICVLAVFTLYSLIYSKVLKGRAWRSKHSHFPRPAKLTSTPAKTTSVITAGKRQAFSKAGGDTEAVALKSENIELPAVEVMTSETVDTTNDNGDVDDGGVSFRTDKRQCCDRVTGTEGEPSNNDSRAHPVSERLVSSATINTTTAIRRPTTSKSSAAAFQPKTTSKKPKSKRRDLNTMANIRTAFMLFVVTVVFIITFLPSCLMALHLINPVAVIFYIYFVNNVANPVIYAFMNQSFRNDLKQVFKKGNHFFVRG